MSSPFPGMNPYLENPDWFPGLHDSLIVFMKGASREPSEHLLCRLKSTGMGRILDSAMSSPTSKLSSQDDDGGNGLVAAGSPWPTLMPLRPW